MIWYDRLAAEKAVHSRVDRIRHTAARQQIRSPAKVSKLAPTTRGPWTSRDLAIVTQELVEGLDGPYYDPGASRFPPLDDAMKASSLHSLLWWRRSDANIRRKTYGFTIFSYPTSCGSRPGHRRLAGRQHALVSQHFSAPLCHARRGHLHNGRAESL